MDQDSIAQQLRHWLTRSLPSNSSRTVSELGISLTSDVGLKRTENQDKVVLLRAQVTPVKSFVVGVLCDGMGGMVDGEACASLAISSFISSCIRNRSFGVDQRLMNAVEHANQEVFKEYCGNGGATLSAFIIDSDGKSSALNVGDSRIYIASGTEVTQLSTDDTIEGQLNREVENSPMSGKLLQFVGIGNELEAHQLELPKLTSISKLVMTSDGVHYINRSTFKSLLSQDVESSELSNRLVDVAKWCGGHDNATALVLSQPSSIFSKSLAALTGTVQLWDYYGDVCFIGIDKASSRKLEAVDLGSSIDNEPSLDNDVKSSSARTGNEIKGASEKNKRQKKQYKKTTKDHEVEKNKTEETKDVPQLRIDFDD
ncbi:PP2C family serine/threonine-protein phosphatase [Vibrio splendidus]